MYKIYFAFTINNCSYDYFLSINHFFKKLLELNLKTDKNGRLKDILSYKQ